MLIKVVRVLKFYNCQDNTKDFLLILLKLSRGGTSSCLHTCLSITSWGWKKFNSVSLFKKDYLEWWMHFAISYQWWVFKIALLITWSVFVFNVEFSNLDKIFKLTLGERQFDIAICSTTVPNIWHQKENLIILLPTKG